MFDACQCSIAALGGRCVCATRKSSLCSFAVALDRLVHQVEKRYPGQTHGAPPMQTAPPVIVTDAIKNTWKSSHGFIRVFLSVDPHVRAPWHPSAYPIGLPGFVAPAAVFGKIFENPADAYCIDILNLLRDVVRAVVGYMRTTWPMYTKMQWRRDRAKLY